VTEVAPPRAAEPTPRAAEPTPRAAARSGWIIQIGAFPEEGAAKQQLSSAQKASRLVGAAEAYTEPVVKGEKTLYRARFAGFVDKDQAEAACKQLKRSDMTCMATRN
jgi:D-alanyl-D-alanine carboxypeptidase